MELSLLKDKLFGLFDEYAKSSNGLHSATKPSSSTSHATNLEEGSNLLMELYFL